MKPSPHNKPPKTGKDESQEMRLNKFLAWCGIASRRKCAEYIKAGLVTVNGQVVHEIGIRVSPKDDIRYQGKKVTLKKNLIYILLNKPKDTITTVKDEKNRKTVIDLVKHKIKDRVYPVGRLDRNTTGLLLLTNDGDLAQKLSHPSFQVKKIYHVTLNTRIKKVDLETIRNGITLEDGWIKVDGINIVENSDGSEIGIEIHSGRNRIVRRIFEHLGYQVKRLDRVYYGGLTKKDISRGRFRHLNSQEIIMLKHFL